MCIIFSNIISDYGNDSWQSSMTCFLQLIFLINFSVDKAFFLEINLVYFKCSMAPLLDYDVYYFCVN